MHIMHLIRMRTAACVEAVEVSLYAYDSEYFVAIAINYASRCFHSFVFDEDMTSRSKSMSIISSGAGSSVSENIFLSACISKIRRFAKNRYHI